MAITNNDLTISNISYTNKDFDAVYNEVLTLAKQISNRYDPTASNESDPFIVLLKLLSFVTDKVNYNADKNILERFLISATQRNSVDELTSTMGYNMHYYKSAKTQVIFKYPFASEGVSITIPKYSIVMTDDEQTAYITLADAVLTYQENVTASSNPVEVIEGKLETLSVLSGTNITYENLDEDKRIYFSEGMIAQNGVFITGGDSILQSETSEDWTSVNNLNTQDYGAKVFKFGYDARRSLPYVQFPDWISKIIGSGLSIKYVVSTGTQGNIKARALTKVGSINAAESSAYDSTKITVSNPNGALNGADPETIDEAINGFKKVIGTFDTLVTCRDYANAIYNMLDDVDNRAVSNVQVGDRRVDINYSANVVTFADTGEVVKSMPLNEMTANELCLYPLQNQNTVTLNTEGKTTSYEDTFKPTADTTYIKNTLESSYKCLSHDYKDLTEDDIYTIKNKYTLEAIISTYNKVTSTDELDIITNVKNALCVAFCAKNVDFGYEIPFDLLLTTIENADTRIKAVALRDPTLHTYVMNKKGEDKILTNVVLEGGTLKTDLTLIVTKNILSGKIEAFDYVDNFEFGFNQTAIPGKDTLPGHIYAITSAKANIGNVKNGDNLYVGITTTEEDNTYTLQANEALQFKTPLYESTGDTYGYGINYFLKFADPAPGEEKDRKTQLDANVPYTLQKDDLLVFQWTDTNTKEPTGITFKQGAIIKSSMTFYSSKKKAESTRPLSARAFTDKDGNYYPATEEVASNLYQLQTNDTVVELKKKEDVLKKSYRCYWYLHNADSNSNMTIPWVSDTYLLRDGEYFFYSDANLTELFAYGAGSTLKRSNNSILSSSRKRIDDISTVYEEGLDALKDYFQFEAFTESRYLTLTQNEILTLAEGSVVRVEMANNVVKENADFGMEVKNNEWTDVNQNTHNIKYKLSKEDAAFTTLAAVQEKWQVRGLLDINAGSDLTQYLVDKAVTTSSGTTHFTQEIQLEKGEYDGTIGVEKWVGTGEFINLSAYTADSNYVTGFKFNSLTQKMGGDKIILTYTDLIKGIGYKDNQYCPELYCFNEATTVSEDASYMALNSADPNYYNLTIPKATASDKPKTITYTLPYITTKVDGTEYQSGTTALMLYIPTGLATALYENKVIINNAYFDEYTGAGIESNKLKAGVHILFFKKANNKIQLEITNNDTANAYNLSLSKIRIINGVMNGVKFGDLGVNPELGIKVKLFAEDTGRNLNLSELKTMLTAGSSQGGKYSEHMKSCNLLNFVDNSRKIQTSSVRTLADAAAFWDYNNVVNKWTIPQIDFTESVISIAHSSKK